MKLIDLRRVTVKKRLRIRFALSNGMECLVTEHGVAQVPALRAVPAFNLEEELVAVQQFLIEPAADGEKDRAKTKPRTYSRDEMAALMASGAGADTRHDEHEE